MEPSYEAYAIYEFFVLLVQFCDGEENLIAMLEGKPMQPHPVPFCLLPPFRIGRFSQLPLIFPILNS